MNFLKSEIHESNKSFFSRKNVNIIYAICFVIVCCINLILHYREPWYVWLEICGSILQIAIPAYVIVPVIWKRDKEGAIQMLKMLSIILLVTWAFKLGLNDFFGISDTRPRGGTMSFPSGHTAGAFSGAVFLTLRYGLKYGFVALPLAGFVGFSRVFSLAHWPIDVIASTVLCIVTGLIFVTGHKR